MKNVALLIGNGVNAMSKGITWEDLLNRILTFCKDDCSVKDKLKPFPLFYEEIFLNAVNRGQVRKELHLKKFIAENVSLIEENAVHGMIRALAPTDILTANYEFLLEGSVPKENEGLINETKFSVFRKYHVNGINFWHVHGDCNYPGSINLGYEHYGGQLQKMRNYVTAGSDYKAKALDKRSLDVRFRDVKPKDRQVQSWIDLFFIKDIHIIGLTLDFVETDLWWLLTYRARKLYYDKKFDIANEITYHVPKKYADAAPFKMSLLKTNGVKINAIDEPHGLSFYSKVLSSI